MGATYMQRRSEFRPTQRRGSLRAPSKSRTPQSMGLYAGVNLRPLRLSRARQVPAETSLDRMAVGQPPAKRQSAAAAASTSKIQMMATSR